MKKKSLLIAVLLSAILFFLFGMPVKKKDFDELMGKGTKHWSHVQQEVDILALKTYKKLFDKNSSRLENWPRGEKIPKVVHFIWVGPKPFPEESVRNVKMWIDMHPSWKFKFWTDNNRAAPCPGMEVLNAEEFPFLKLKRCYDLTQNYGEKSDVLRFEILFQEGGIYVDHDANCLKKFDALSSYFDFFCGLEAPHPPFVGLNVTAGIGVLGSRPGHPVIEKVIDLIDSRWDVLEAQFPGMDPHSRTTLTMHRTYIALTDALSDGLGEDDIVLPAAFFFAKSGLKPIYSKHYFANSWSDGHPVKKKENKKKTGHARGHGHGHEIRKEKNASPLLSFVPVPVPACVPGLLLKEKSIEK